MTKKTSLGNKEQRHARLIEVLQFSASEESCQVCLAQLDDYIAAQLAGEDYLTEFADVAIHLDACLTCADTYARFYELAWAEANDQLPQLENIPEPDLSFLVAEKRVSPTPRPPHAPPEEPGLVQRLQGALSYRGNKLTLRLSTDLLPLLRPTLSAPPTRAPADRSRYGEVLFSLKQIHTPTFDLPLTFTAYNDAHRPGTCLVEVIVEPSGQGWPDLAGHSVTLFIGDEKRTSTTDDWGVAAFDDVPTSDLARLVLEVDLTQ